MSLINQVLLDLDRRHAQQESVPLSAKSVRQTPPRKSRLALRIVAAFVAVGAGAGAAVVASSALPVPADRVAASQGVVKPPVGSGSTAATPTIGRAGMPTSAVDKVNVNATASDRSSDPFANDDTDSIGGNPLGGTSVRVASNTNDDVQLLARSPTMPGDTPATSARAAALPDGADDIATLAPAPPMPRMWDASPVSVRGSRAKAERLTSAADESRSGVPDARVATLSPNARRTASSTAQSVIEAQDPDATLRKARSMVKPSVVRTEVKSSDAADGIAAAPLNLALAPPVVPPAATRRVGSRGPAATATATEASVEKRATPLTAADRADAEYQKALALHLQGQAAEARLGFASALREDRRHAGARQALAVGLVGDGKLDDAQAMLVEGLELNPRELQLSATLARIKAQRLDMVGAIATLKAALSAGPSGAQKSEVADARALLATLQQKSGAHAEAIDNYSQALRQVPGNGTWWIGLGISLAASGRADSARDAFERARATDSLSRDLDRYVEQRLATAAR